MIKIFSNSYIAIKTRLSLAQIVGPELAAFNSGDLNIHETKIAARSSKAPTLSSHLDFLDGLRALAALYVVFHHAWPSKFVSEGSFFKLIEPLMMQGRYAVDLFIVISGYCLMLPVAKNNGILKNGTLFFYKKRANRILPTYYFALLLSLILIYALIGDKTGTKWDVALPVTSWDILTHFLLIQDFFSETIHKINYPFWSVSVEWHIYFLFPLILVFWKKLGTIPAVFTIMVSTFLLTIGLDFLGVNVYDVAVHYLILFTLGILAAQVSFSNLEPRITVRNSFIWKPLFIMCFLIVLLFAKFYSLMFLDLIFGICSAVLLVLLSSGKINFALKVLSWKPLVFLGTFAYSIYLMHAPLIQIVDQYVISPLNLPKHAAVASTLFIGVPFVVAICYLFFLVAEKPFIKFKLKK